MQKAEIAIGPIPPYYYNFRPIIMVARSSFSESEPKTIIFRGCFKNIFFINHQIIDVA